MERRERVKCTKGEASQSNRKALVKTKTKNKKYTFAVKVSSLLKHKLPLSIWLDDAKSLSLQQTFLLSLRRGDRTV